MMDERILFITKTTDPICFLSVIALVFILIFAIKTKRIYLEGAATFALLFGAIAYLFWRSEYILSVYR